VLTEEPVPTYLYACTACGERLEAVQSFSDAPLTECATCHGRLRKVFTPVGVVFKGSGFYKTDSRQPARAAAKDGPGGEPDKAAPSGTEPATTAAESKPSGAAGAAGEGAAKGGASPKEAGSAKTDPGTAAGAASGKPAKAGGTEPPRRVAATG
jgi:putative FmdB family regulatory protein